MIFFKKNPPLQGRFPFGLLAKYPHLMKEEVDIWERFIAKYPDFFDSVDYDVKVGKGREYKTVPDDAYKKDLIELSKKRIDVVGYKNKEVFIVEIKPNALLESIGQLLGEQYLWIKDFQYRGKVSMLLITDRENPDMRELTKKFKIEYIIV